MELSNIGGPGLLVVIVAALLVFGANRIPQMFRGVGEGIKEFKKSMREMGEEESPQPPAHPAEPASSTEARDRTTGTS